MYERTAESVKLNEKTARHFVPGLRRDFPRARTRRVDTSPGRAYSSPAPPPPPGGATCTYATTENPWLDGQGCELCWDDEDNDCNGLKDGQEPGCWNRCNSPILVDTDGDGFALTSAAGSAGILPALSALARRRRFAATQD